MADNNRTIRQLRATAALEGMYLEHAIVVCTYIDRIVERVVRLEMAKSDLRISQGSLEITESNRERAGDQAGWQESLREFKREVRENHRAVLDINRVLVRSQELWEPHLNQSLSCLIAAQDRVRKLSDEPAQTSTSEESDRATT